MRPIQWLQRVAPGHSTAFYVGLVCLGIIAAIAVKNVAAYFSQMLAAHLKAKVSVSVRDALFRRLQYAELSTFEQHPGGELANIFLVETYRATVAVDASIGFVQRASNAIFYVGALVYISPSLTALVAALGIILGSALSFVYGRLKRAGVDLTEANHRLSAQLQQTFAGVRVVRATHSEEREIAAFHESSVRQARAEEHSQRATSLLHPLTETLAVVGAMAIIACAYIFLVRSGQMLSSYLLAYGFVLLRLLPLLNQLYGFQGHLSYLAGGIHEVDKWLEVPQYPSRPFGSRTFTGVARELAFDRVSYVYETGTHALTDVTFVVPAGRTIAIVGSSGSGKSTLASLVLRMRAPSSGRMLVDGVDAWEFSPESWHRGVALVEQDAFLFYGTLRENIVYGCPDVTEAAIDQALAIANLADVVASLPHGLDTLVGERGTMLSGGQRQRVAIARAVVRDPSVLILDEATSHLDTVSEQLVQQALQQASRGRTTVVIAHRLSTIREADAIIVLEQGRIVEQGTWDALFASGGTFNRLVASGLS
jgi:ABC-type multidrug transport system fused ATPase/permease subunit